MSVFDKKDMEETGLNIREEFDSLKTQVQEVLDSLKSMGQKKGEKIAEKLESEFDHCQEKAKEKMQDMYSSGAAGVDELNAAIRRQPVASLLIAFGVGYILSRLLDRD